MTSNAAAPANLRQRPRATVRIDDAQNNPPRSRQRRRITEFQARWQNIKEDLPPQLSRRHIGMISVGGVIGTGLFVGSDSALKAGGPIGALLGYAIMGTVVYSLCVSIGEIIAFLPNVGGVVGLADLYVDPALGFSLGWAAWYNWAVTIPVEVAAAAVVVRFWDTCEHIRTPVWIGLFLCAAVSINLFPSRVYGEAEFWFSTVKILTIIFLIISSFIIDLGASGTWYGLDTWQTPFNPEGYLGIKGAKGNFLGFWGCLMQAAFSFFGSEVPGIAAGEVINATINVPRALRRVWLRITLFYLGGIFVAGLFVPFGVKQSFPDSQTGLETCPNNETKAPLPDGTANASPFVEIFKQAGVGGLANLVNAAILISAWSAAASDVYISSRFLFFLARRGHAPTFLATLTRFPRRLTARNTSTGVTPASVVLPHTYVAVPESAVTRGLHAPSEAIRMTAANQRTDDESSSGRGSFEAVDLNHDQDTRASSKEASEQKKPPTEFIIPLVSVLASSSVGLLAFLSATKGGPSAAFNWLGTVTSVASLQAWIGMLYTYIRMHQGTIYAEKHGQYGDAIRRIKRNRHAGQPYLAWYAFIMCILVLLTNGWSVFLDAGWRIADQPDLSPDEDVVPQRVGTFLSAYIPLPLFVLLTIGYKLVHQTKMVPLDKMVFNVYDVQEVETVPNSKYFLARLWYKII